jgi:hypothetical protein
VFETPGLEIIGGKLIHRQKFVWSVAMEHASPTVGLRVSVVADRMCPTHKQLSGNGNKSNAKERLSLETRQLL